MNLKASNPLIREDFKKILAKLPRSKRRQMEKEFLKRAKKLRKEKQNDPIPSKNAASS